MPYDKPEQGLTGEIRFRDYNGSIGDKRVLLLLDSGSGCSRDGEEMLAGLPTRFGLSLFSADSPFMHEWKSLDDPVQWVFRRGDGEIMWFDVNDDERTFEECSPLNVLRVRRDLLGPPPEQIAGE